jgi:hypothetical protein
MRVCTKCGHTLPVCKFWTKTNGKPRSVCKNCWTKRVKHWQEKNREKCRSYGRKCYRNHPNQGHKHKLMYRYGITLSDYNSKLSKQGGACAICRAPESKQGQHLSVDHCHTSGINRGLLCDRCNRALGAFKDSISLLERAVEYLREYTLDQALKEDGV